MFKSLLNENDKDLEIYREQIAKKNVALQMIGQISDDKNRNT